MMSRKVTGHMLEISVGGAVALTLVAALLSAQVAVWGGLIGFLAGMAQAQWLFRDLRKAMERNLSRVLMHYWKSLVVRWGFVAVFAFLMTRYFPQGLFLAVIGFALGVIVSTVIVCLSIADKEKGGEK